MPEGDTIHYAANRIRPILEGHVPDELRTPHPRFRRDRWPERLAGRAVEGVDAHGKHLFLRFEGGLVDPLAPADDRRLGHLRARRALAPVAAPRVARAAPRQRRGRAVRRAGPRAHDRVAHAARPADRRPRAGHHQADEFDEDEFLRRLRHDDPTRPIGDALLDQRTLAGIGNLWKVEGCFAAGIDPWRPTGRGGRRGGAAHRPGHPPVDAGVGHARDAGRLPGDLQQKRAAVPALRHAHPLARPVGRQPHDVLVPGVPDVRRVGHKGADLIAPGNTAPSFDAAVEAGVDMIEFDVLPEHLDGTGGLLPRPRLRRPRRAARRTALMTLDEGLDHLCATGIDLDVDLKLAGLRGPRGRGDPRARRRRSACSSRRWRSSACERIRADRSGHPPGLVGPASCARTRSTRSSPPCPPSWRCTSGGACCRAGRRRRSARGAATR